MGPKKGEPQSPGMDRSGSFDDEDELSKLRGREEEEEDMVVAMEQRKPRSQSTKLLRRRRRLLLNGAGEVHS